jgi:serine/threonine-protein kinase
LAVRHAYPSGQSSASKIKALYLCLEAMRGEKAALAWLDASRLAKVDIEDETRLFPLGALRLALETFSKELPDGLGALAPYLVAQENLGVWARILRGARAPEQAFVRIDSSDSEHGRTTRWETTEARAGSWRGRVRIGHDPSLEKDGLLARMRVAELEVVPMLFGFERGAVTTGAKTDDAQEYEVRWTVPTQARGVLIGGASGVALGAGLWAALPHAAALASAAGPLLGAVGGWAWAQSARRQVDARAQELRVSALERSLALRERESHVGAGDLEGTVVAGHYRIGARMGSGASGAVYQATRITDGVRVAIKLLRAATAHDAVASDRLRREAEALGLSWHPNVVEVIDHGHLPDGTSYLVMELLVGETLATRLKYRSRLPAAEVLPIGLHVAEALVAIHAAGVVHRDLKPANIYLVKDEEGAERAKILDFGIARVEWEEMRITNMGAPLGTPGYMSPEQESGGEVDARSDLYAIGAVLYECFVGEPPPPSLAPADMWTPGKRPPPSIGLRLPPDAPREGDAASGVHPASRRMPSAAPAPVDLPVVSPEWRALIERALAKRPEDRWEDARSLVAAIRAAGEGTPRAPHVSSETK